MIYKRLVVAAFLMLSVSAASPAWANRPDTLKQEIRHELVMLPYYSVFDWLEASVDRNRQVILTGQVTRPTLKKDAETVIRRIEGVTAVVNDIEVLPLSNNDDDLRRLVYWSIYKSDSPLFKYALQSVGPIHILVKNGNVTLKGVVASSGDRDLAYIRARQVSGAFSVKNELKVEQPAT